MAGAFYEEGLTSIHAADYGEVAESGAAMVVQRLARAGLTSGLIVELGCGPGVSARRFVDAGYDVVACDVAQPMVERARALVPEAEITHGDVDDFLWPTSAVAVVAFGEVLSYAMRAEVFDGRVARVVDGARCVLSEGGALVFDLVLAGRAGPTGERHLHHDRRDYELFVDASEDRTQRTFDRFIHGTTRKAPELLIDEHHRQITTDASAIRELLDERGFAVECFGDYNGQPLGATGWGVFFGTKVT